MFWLFVIEQLNELSPGGGVPQLGPPGPVLHDVGSRVDVLDQGEEEACLPVS